MSEARTDTNDTRPQEAEAGGAGKHRGGAARTEDYASPAHGKHRRPEQDGRTN